MYLLSRILALTFLLSSFSAIPLFGQSPNIDPSSISTGARSKRKRKRASRQAADFSSQWQGEPEVQTARPVVPDSLSNETPDSRSAEAFATELENGKPGQSDLPELVGLTDEAVVAIDSSENQLSQRMSLAEQRKAKMSAIRQARKKLEKKSPDYARDFAYLDLQERFLDAEDIRQPFYDNALIFTFKTSQGPKVIAYDEDGEWMGTLSLLNHNQVPVGARKLARSLEMEVTQFRDKFKLEVKDLRRPVFALYSPQSELMTDSVLLGANGRVAENVVVGLEVFDMGKHFTFGDEIQQLLPENIGFLALLITADGHPVPEREIAKILDTPLFLFPDHYLGAGRKWTPPLGWQGGKNWYSLPEWSPEYNRWYPEEDWYVDAEW